MSISDKIRLNSKQFWEDVPLALSSLLMYAFTLSIGIALVLRILGKI
jgi:hypothetical protein